MALGTGVLNTVVLGASGGVSQGISGDVELLLHQSVTAQGDAELLLNQTVAIAIGDAELLFDQTVRDAGNVELTLIQTVVTGIGDAELILNQTITGIGDVELVLNQGVIEILFGDAELLLNQVVTDAGLSELILDQSVDYQTSDVALILTQNVGDTGEVSLTLSQNVYDPAIVEDSWKNWCVKITVGGIDYTDSQVRQSRIEAETSTARIAEFTLLMSGQVSPLQWIGKSIQLNYQQNTGAAWRRFNGVIEKAKYDIASKTMAVTCTDDLQRVIDTYSNDQLKQLTGGYWSKHVFNDKNIGWDYLQDLLKTVDKSVHLNSNRQLVVSHLQNKAVFDYQFDDNLILDDSLSVDLVENNQLINTVDVEFKARFERLYHRKRHIFWQHSKKTLYSYFIEPTTIPQKSTVSDAIENAGWTYTGGSYTPLWPSGEYLEGVVPYVWINNNPDGIIGFSVSCAFRWQQSITDTFKIRVESVSGTPTPDDLIHKIRASASFDTTHQEWSKEQKETAILENSDLIAGNSGPVGGGVINAPEKQNKYKALPDYFSAIGNGDWAFDDVQNSEISEAVDTLIAEAVTTINSSNRKNKVIFQLPLMPFIELGQTIRINDPDVTCKGVVERFSEDYNFDTGDPITEVELSLSASGSGQDIVAQSFSAPPSPKIEAVEPSPIGVSLTLNTYIGRERGGPHPPSPPQNPDWRGMILNGVDRTPTQEGFAQIKNGARGPEYEEGLSIEFEEVLDENRLNKDRQIDHNIKIVVPDNELTITA